MPVGCPACLPAHEMTDDPPGNYASARLWLLTKRSYEPTAGMTAASKSGMRRGSVMEDRPELGPPVSRPLSGADLDQERPSGHFAGVEDQRWTCTL